MELGGPGKAWWRWWHWAGASRRPRPSTVCDGNLESMGREKDICGETRMAEVEQNCAGCFEGLDSNSAKLAADDFISAKLSHEVHRCAN